MAESRLNRSPPLNRPGVSGVCPGDKRPEMAGLRPLSPGFGQMIGCPMGLAVGYMILRLIRLRSKECA